MKKALLFLLLLPALSQAQLTAPIRSTSAAAPSDGTVNLYQKPDGNWYQYTGKTGGELPLSRVVGPKNRFLPSQVGTTYNRTTFLALYNAAIAVADKTVLDLEGRTYVLDQGIVIDQQKMQVMNGGLSCPTLTSGTCVTVRGLGSGGTSPYLNATTGMYNLEVSGPGKSYTNTVGISFESSGAANSGASAVYKGIVVHGFGVGKQFGANTYLIAHDGGGVFDNGIGHKFLNATNAGENIVFYGGYANFSNDTAFVQLNPNADINYTNVSLDYNNKAIGRLAGGSVDLTSPHLEWRNVTGPQFILSGNGTSLRIVGGWMLSTDTLSKPEAVFDIRTNPGKGGGVWMDNVRVSTVTTTSDMWCTSATTGNFYPTRLHSYEVMQVPKFTSLVENLALNYLPDTDAFQDKIIVQGTDSTLVADPTATSVAVTNSALSLTTISGSNYYRHTKIYGGGSTSRAQWVFPVEPGRATNIKLNYSKPGLQTGIIYLTWYYTSEPDQHGRIGRKQAIGATPITLTSSPASGLFSSAEPLTRAPAWARRLVFELNADSSGPGDILFSKILVNQQ